MRFPFLPKSPSLLAQWLLLEEQQTLATRRPNDRLQSQAALRSPTSEQAANPTNDAWAHPKTNTSEIADILRLKVPCEVRATQTHVPMLRCTMQWIPCCRLTASLQVLS